MRKTVTSTSQICISGNKKQKNKKAKKNNSFARFASFPFFSVTLHFFIFIFGHLADVVVLSTRWNDLFCSCVDDVSVCWQMLNFAVLFLKRRFQDNSRIVGTHVARVMTLNNWKMIAETRGCIFRWLCYCRRRRLCLSSLLWASRR